MAKENPAPVVPPHTVRHVDGVMHLQLHLEATRVAPQPAPANVPAREERSR
jgi:hypothetical protein